MFQNTTANYRKKIAMRLNTEDVYLFAKGRVALYAILKAIGIEDGDEVLVQGYTCVVVVNAILYVGAKPVFVDIDPVSYCASLEKYRLGVTDKTKVIICQNTYGLSHDVDLIANFARDKGIVTIEDCTHGFGGRYNGRDNGTVCDFAFYSTQWNKPFSTGLGGFGIAKSMEHKIAMEKAHSECKEPKFVQALQLWVLLQLRNRLVGNKGFNVFRDLYRFLSKKGLVIGSSTREELDEVEMPKNYLNSFPGLLSRAGALELDRLDEVLVERWKNGLWYSGYLANLKKNRVAEHFNENHSFLTYPLLVHDRVAFTKNAVKLGVPIGDWFVSPIHPIVDGFDKWGIKFGELQIANWCASRVVNLPTVSVDKKRVEKLLLQQVDNILDESERYQLDTSRNDHVICGQTA